MGHTSNISPVMFPESPLDWYTADGTYFTKTEGGTELTMRRGPEGWTVTAYNVGDLRIGSAETLVDALSMAHDFGFEMDEAGMKLAAKRVAEELRYRLADDAERFAASVRAHTPRDMTTDLDNYLQDLLDLAEEYFNACEWLAT